jgi:sugar lactone lactonase YvrE
MEPIVEVVTDHVCFLGEGPVWDSKLQSICWVDIMNGQIHEFGTRGGTLKTTDVHEMVGAVALCADGNLLAALKNGLAIVDRKSGGITPLSHPEAHLPANRFNDGKCDGEGRFWIGSMAVDETLNQGSVYVFDADGGITKKIEGTTISNGLAWNARQDTFYFIDTPTSAVVAYDYDADTANITNKRTIITFDVEVGHPDGMTIDADDMLWIAHWDGWQVSRWNPATGEKLFSLKMPVANVTSCTFGGDNFEDLYITTARKGLAEDELRRQPMAGALFVWKNSGYKGLPAVEYRQAATTNF